MALEAAVGLIDRGIHVTVVLPVDGPLRDELRAAGAEVVIHDVPVLRKSAMKPGGFVRLVRDLVLRGPRMAAALRRTRPDLVYVNTIVQPWWALAARLARKKVVVHVREAEVDPPAVVRRALLSPLLLAHSVIANSRFTERQILRDCPGVRSRTRVIYNGKDWSSYVVAHEASQEGVFRVLYLGRLSPRKGTDVAVRAVALLRETGVDARLTLAGAVFPGYEWYERDLTTLADELGLDAGVLTFTGFVSRTQELFSTADALVVPSRAEPFGTVAAEGLAAGVPVVVSDVQGLVEIVTDGEDGLVVPPDDPDALASALRTLADDPLAGATLVEKGRRSVHERFSRERYRAAIANEIQRVGESR
ncbi:glycosyltransferase family 4 protein [Microbacterium sp. NPDC089188]|uniref:glycosyltransferase family 4 protein n=1 Tax=Microbacterium sp. NPDC089188 TaxID=3154971 RepID=UPI00343F017A